MPGVVNNASVEMEHPGGPGSTPASGGGGWHFCRGGTRHSRWNSTFPEELDIARVRLLYNNIERISPRSSPRRRVNCAAAAPLMAR